MKAKTFTLGLVLIAFVPLSRAHGEEGRFLKSLLLDAEIDDSQLEELPSYNRFVPAASPAPVVEGTEDSKAEQASIPQGTEVLKVVNTVDLLNRTKMKADCAQSEEKVIIKVTNLDELLKETKQAKAKQD